MDLFRKAGQLTRVEAAIRSDVDGHGAFGHDPMKIRQLPFGRFRTMHEMPVQPDRRKGVLQQLFGSLLGVHRRYQSLTCRRN